MCVFSRKHMWICQKINEVLCSHWDMILTCRPPSVISEAKWGLTLGPSSKMSPYLNRAERPSNQTGQIKLSPFAKWENSGPLVFNEVNGFSQRLQATGAELCIDPSLPGLTFSSHHSFSNVEQESVSFPSRACILSGEVRRHSGQGKTYTIPPRIPAPYVLHELHAFWSC